MTDQQVPIQERFPELVEVVIEIPAGSRNKYEYDEQAGVIRLDRVLSSAVFYNFDYGFVERTRADDGDHGWSERPAALDLLRADRARWLAETTG